MKHTKQRRERIALGTVSHGMLRTEDLIPAFLEELECHTGAEGQRAYRRIVRENPDLLDEDGNLRTEEEYAHSENAGDYDEAASVPLNEIIMEELDVLAPPFCYFGAHEGDGSDFGFWISMEALAEAEGAGEVWRDPDDGSRCPKTVAYRLVVSDHGNMTLYHRNGVEVWGVV